MKAKRNIARKADRRISRALRSADGDGADAATRKRLRKARKSLRKLIRIDRETNFAVDGEQFRLERHARGQAFSVYALED